MRPPAAFSATRGRQVAVASRHAIGAAPKMKVKAPATASPLPGSANLSLAAAASHKLKKEAKRKEKRRREAEGKNGGGGRPSASAAAGSHRIFVGRLGQKTTEQAIRAFFGPCGAVKGVDMLTRRGTNRFKGAAFVVFESAKAVALALALDGAELDGKSAAVQQPAAGGAAAAAPKAAANPPHPAAAKKVSAKKGTPSAAAAQFAAANKETAQNGGAAPLAAAAPVAAAEKEIAKKESSKKETAKKEAAEPVSSSSIFVGNLPEDVTEKAVRKIFRDAGPIQNVKLLPPVKGEVKGFIDFRLATGAAAAVALDGSTHFGRRITVMASRRVSTVTSDRRSAEAKKRRGAKRKEARGGREGVHGVRAVLAEDLDDSD